MASTHTAVTFDGASVHGTSAPGTPTLASVAGPVTSQKTVGGRGSPSEQDLESWSTLADIFTWVGLSTEAGPESPEGSLLDHMGLQIETPIREVGMIDEADFTEALSEWTIDGVRPPLLLRSKAKMVGHLSRVYMGKEYTVEQTLAYEATQASHKRAVELRAATPKQTIVQASEPAVTSAPVRIAKFKDIADDARAGEVAVIDPETHLTGI